MYVVSRPLELYLSYSVEFHLVQYSSTYTLECVRHARMYAKIIRGVPSYQLEIVLNIP